MIYRGNMETLKIPPQRFGECRSGKPICTYLTDDLSERAELVKDFNDKDHFDAFALFQHLVRREIRRKSPHGNELQRFQSWSDLHYERISDTAMKDGLSIITSLDIVKHGKGRADDFFRD